MVLRVAMVGFLHETNTFAPNPADLTAFETGGGYIPLSRGAEIAHRAAGRNLGIAGAMAHGAAQDWRIEPVLWAGAIPSAHVTEAAYEAITGEILAGLAALGALDGVFLDLHGAMVATHLDAGEGALLDRVRAALGASVPIAASLDLHGNISARMVEAADLLVGFRAYPHVDMADTGRRAAIGLGRMMARGTRPAKAFRRLPYLVPISWQSTLADPARRLYSDAAGLEADEGDSVSLFMGFPAADIPDCAPSVIAYADTEGRANDHAEAVAAAYAAAERDFRGKTYTPEEAVAHAMAADVSAGPVVIADTQDNPGAGGVSRTMGLLKAMVAAGAEDAAIGLIVDPEAAAAAHRAGIGASLRLALGGAKGVSGDSAFEAEFTVEAISDGLVETKGPFYGSGTIDLGPAAQLRIGGVRIPVVSLIAQTADREFFRFLGIEPEAARMVGVKSSTHFRADFTDMASQILICVAPGPMPMDTASLPWTRIDPTIRLSPLGPTRPEKDRAPAA